MTLFVIFGAVALGSAVAMILSRNAVHAALLLVVNLLAVAILFLSLGAEFLFVAQIIVYAGAIVVLFVFVIMLLGVDRSESLMEPRGFQIGQIVVGVIVAAMLFGSVWSATQTKQLVDALPEAPRGFGSASSIGQLLFSAQLLPFELTGLLLLVATIGILMLAKRKPT
jgi:NADH-quinone oxidoreductase subunit J